MLSFQKGWFVYTPFMLWLLPALYYLFKKSKYHFYSFTFFATFLIYIFSSWWNWFFGDSFGMRPMVDYYALFALPITLWFNTLTKKTKIAVTIVSILLAFFNIFQSYQYSKGIIHVDSMDFKSYKYVFLKTGNYYRNIIGADSEYFYGNLSTPLLIAKSDFKKAEHGWRNPDKNTFSSDKNGTFELFNSKTIYGPSYTFNIDTIVTDKMLYLQLKATLSEIDTNACKNALFVVDVRNNNGETIFYKAFDLKKTPDKIVQKIIISRTGIKLPVLLPGYTVKTYIWNKGKRRFKLYSFEINLYEIIPH